MPFSKPSAKIVLSALKVTRIAPQLVTLAVLAVAAWLAFTYSVWPGALLVRATFKQGGERMRQAQVPLERADVQVLADLSGSPRFIHARR